MQTFVKVSHKVLEKLGEIAQRKHCPSVFAVYMALLFHADREGKCFPSYERIKEVSGIGSRTSISKALKTLEECGLITKRTRYGQHGSTVYRLLSCLKSQEEATPHPANAEKQSESNECTVQSTNWTDNVHLVDSESPVGGPPKSNCWTAKVHSMDCQSPVNGPKLYSFNYNHLTISHLTKGKNENEREKERDKVRHYQPFAEREKWEKKIKETVSALLGRDIVPLEQYFLEKALFSIPGEELLQFLEKHYLDRPQEFKEQGLFILEEINL